MSLFFLSPVFPTPTKRPRQQIPHPFKCPPIHANLNINTSTDPSREDEIAAKIANLRKQTRLKSQQPSSSPSETSETQQSTPSLKNPSAFNDLPDWKKEEILKSQISQAEQFLNPTTPAPSSAPSNLDANDGQYKPKISTWGVFPRPDNISRTYGGGKKITPGGIDLDSESSKERDAAVAAKLAKYRAAKGIDMQREERHSKQIEQALEKAAFHTAKSQHYDSIRELEEVLDFVSQNSRLGGSVYLALALAYDTIGRREEAKEIYTALRRNAFAEVSGKAKQLLQGFEAMDMLKISDDTASEGFKVINFQLPDVSQGIEKRYETVVGTGGKGGQKGLERLDWSTQVLLFALFAAPLAFLLFVKILN